MKIYTHECRKCNKQYTNIQKGYGTKCWQGHELTKINIFTCNDKELYIISKIIAEYLYWERCSCDHDVGYTCSFCTKHKHYFDNDNFQELINRYSELIKRYRLKEY